MSKQAIIIEQRPQGDFSYKKPGAKRASGVCSTQLEAIARAKKLIPGAPVLAQRVRDMGRPRQGKWRQVYPPTRN